MICKVYVLYLSQLFFSGMRNCAQRRTDLSQLSLFHDIGFFSIPLCSYVLGVIDRVIPVSSFRNSGVQLQGNEHVDAMR